MRNRVKALLRIWVKALHGGCLARFLKPSFEGNDRRPKESADLYCRDITALRRRVRRISPKSKISSPGLRYGECLGLPFADVIAHLKVPDVVLCLRIALGLHLSPDLLTILKRSCRQIRGAAIGKETGAWGWSKAER